MITNTNTNTKTTIILARHDYIKTEGITLTGSNPAIKQAYVYQNTTKINPNAPLLAAKRNLMYSFNLKYLLDNEALFQNNALPTTDAPYWQVVGLISQFSVEISEVISDPFDVLYGHIPDAHFEKYGQNYLNVIPSFLSFAPRLKKIKSTTAHYLYYLNNLIATPTAIKLKAKLFLYDAITPQEIVVITVPNTLKNDIYGFNVSLKSILEGTTIAPEEVQKYQVFLSDQDDATLTDTNTFIIDDAFAEDTVSIIWRNSLGVFESFDFDAFPTQTIDYTYSQFQTETQQLDYDVTLIEKITVRCAALEQNWIDHLANDLLLSNEIYWLKNDGRKIRLSKTQKSIKTRDEKSSYDSIEIEFRTAKL